LNSKTFKRVFLFQNGIVGNLHEALAILHLLIHNLLIQLIEVDGIQYQTIVGST